MANINSDLSLCDKIIGTQEKQDCLLLYNYDLSKCVDPDVYSINQTNTITENRLLFKFKTCMAVDNENVQICDSMIASEREECYSQYETGLLS